jgi:hypothetical protein
MVEYKILWHSVNDAMPKRNEYVLIETRFCRYPACVGYYNGVDWISADDKTKIMNTINWAEITMP